MVQFDSKVQNDSKVCMYMYVCAQHNALVHMRAHTQMLCGSAFWHCSLYQQYWPIISSCTTLHQYSRNVVLSTVLEAYIKCIMCILWCGTIQYDTVCYTLVCFPVQEQEMCIF